jgi:ribosomal protein S18 acetylase RimI-like enzyme
MEIIFSEIDHDDLVDCSELFVSIFKEPPWNENWDIEDAFERLSTFLSSPKTISFKAEAEGRICGFLIGEIQRWKKSNVYYLKEMCVTTSMQRQGIGKAMMDQLERILQEEHVSQIYLVTQRNGVPSKFYSRLEFKENSSIMVMAK